MSSPSRSWVFGKTYGSAYWELAFAETTDAKTQSPKPPALKDSLVPAFAEITDAKTQ